ncbi:hypothetical protein BBP40_007002 [Aspergillus hancockii]|nr:hypothetical protein BBP40_007002 [Aspergillus hancockii]
MTTLLMRDFCTTSAGKGLASGISVPVSQEAERYLGLWLDLELSFVLHRAKAVAKAGTLAFLAHVKDDAEHIPAVCIEKDPDSVSLNVILAISKAKAYNGDDVIRRIQQGFDKILTVLAKSNAFLNIKDQILFMVVSMCSTRILSCLRLDPTGWKPLKQPIKDIFQEVAMAFTKNDRYKLENRNILKSTELLTARVKEVEKLVDL